MCRMFHSSPLVCVICVFTAKYLRSAICFKNNVTLKKTFSVLKTFTVGMMWISGGLGGLRIRRCLQMRCLYEQERKIHNYFIKTILSLPAEKTRVCVCVFQINFDEA